MVNRKKRLRKGVKSLEKQIRLHENKRKGAQEEGDFDSERYYKKELSSLKDTKERKERNLRR